jgi:hypothetical protein
MPEIRFKTKLFKIGSWTILRLPEEVSAKLPSRGQTMVKGTVNGFYFHKSLEPDGKWSHWLCVDKAMSEGADAQAGDTVAAVIESTKDWPEPEIPDDLKAALKATPHVDNLWKNITPMARWDWIRWISGTKQTETRKRRIEAAISKLHDGEKRPCCFNRVMCTDPHVSKNGVLADPTQ